MKNVAELSVDTEDDTPEDWQIDKSNELATEFLDKEVIPLIDDFEFENDDEHYVPGVASFMLYIKLIEHLSTNGWTLDELKQAVDEFSLEHGYNNTLH